MAAEKTVTSNSALLRSLEQQASGDTELKGKQFK